MSIRDAPPSPPSHSSTQRYPSASPNADAGPTAPLTPASRESRSGSSSSSNSRQLAYAVGTPSQPATAVLPSDLPQHERTRSLSANSSLAYAAAANSTKHATDLSSFGSAPPHAAAPHSAHVHSQSTHSAHAASASIAAPITPPRVPAMVLPSARSHAAASSQVSSAAAEPTPAVAVARTPIALNLNAARMQRAATVASPRSSGAVVAVAASPSSASSSACSGGPPPFLRMNSVSLTPTLLSSSSAIAWVAQTNRDLVRTFFAKKQHTHRGILESHFMAMQHDSTQTAAGGHVRRPSSASAPSLQQQLLHAPLTRFHIGVVGSAACGKTSTLHNVSGRAVPLKHVETSGMHLMDLTWPYKTADGSVGLCDYLFWDSGFTSSAQYKYVANTPELHAHLVLYFVSCVDRASWLLAQRRLDEDAAKPVAKLLILTKSHSNTHAQHSDDLVTGSRAALRCLLTRLCVCCGRTAVLCVLRIDDRTLKREVTESDILAFQDRFNRQHYPAAVAAAPPSSSASSAASSPRSYPRGSLVVCKIANWPISSEPFYTRPGVTSLLNTIAAMCTAQTATAHTSK